MTNLTISVDPDVLRRARIRALQRNESVNAYLAEVLRQYADAPAAATVFEAAAQIAESGAAHTPRQPVRAWTRDELHRG
ncbi:MAG: hypothetical protein IPK37_19625 [Austwickia sp.]|jgi:plasmid stability protein|nr:MAG: hypothetical protein IPK37_19625 [Austwickia sp.]